MQELIGFIKKYSKGLDKDAEFALRKYSEFESYKKNDFILSQGQYCNKVWFVKSGLIRRFYIEDGKEITIWIFCENELFTSMFSYFQKKPSHEFIQACEDSELISMSRTNSEKLNKYPQIELFSRLHLEEQIAKIDIVSKKLTLMKTKERYDTFKEMAPSVFKRAKLGHIASILGVSQETLSRIRAKK